MAEHSPVQDVHLLFNAEWRSAQNVDMNFRCQDHMEKSIRAYAENELKSRDIFQFLFKS